MMKTGLLMQDSRVVMICDSTDTVTKKNSGYEIRLCIVHGDCKLLILL